MREELLQGLLGADVLGFHTEDWADNFLLCCRAFLDVDVDLDRRRIRTGTRVVRVEAYPASPDVDALAAEFDSPAVQEATRRIEAARGGCKLVLKVDRAELSKNILRALEAYRQFLRNSRAWRRRVRFLVLLMPTRTDVADYAAYARDCVRLAAEINDELGDDGWSPVDLSIEDDHASVVAAYGLYDVLLVNPIFDGMNLVAKEGPAVNRRDGVLILSENSGASRELDAGALCVSPFDLLGTERALATALEMAPEERARRARSLRNAVLRNRPERWVERQLADLDAIGS
jgi:trehalose 6-phosphate synthase